MNRKKIIVVGFAFGIAFLFSTRGFTQSNHNLPDNMAGLYWSPKKDAKIEIFRKDSLYFGRSVWVAIPRKDLKNPVEGLRKRDLLGMELLTGFSLSDEALIDGKIYDPESGKTYDCKINKNGDNLKVRGYIGISLFGRTEIFEKVK